MKRLLLPLLAALALPTAVHAESAWLLLTLRDGSGNAVAIEKIKLDSLLACEKVGYVMRTYQSLPGTSYQSICIQSDGWWSTRSPSHEEMNSDYYNSLD
jgi:hypothetical protein